MNPGETISTSAWPSPLDAIVLAGTDSNPKRMVQGRNKAFLEVGGEVLVRRVVEALLGASSIGLVFVVGPSEPLRNAPWMVCPMKWSWWTRWGIRIEPGDRR